MGIIEKYRIDASYVRGFGDADGTCQGNIVQLANTNYELLFAIMTYLHSVNIKSGIYTHKIIMSQITGKPHKRTYTLVISGVDNLARYAVLIGFNIDYKMEHLTTWIKSQCAGRRKPGNLETYYKYIELKSLGVGVTRMSKILNLTLSNLQYRIKYKYPIADDLIEALTPFQPK